MKRILGIRVALCVCGLSVFFTGCNGGKVNSYMEVPIYDETGVEPPERPTEETRETVRSKDVDQIVRSEADKLMEQRFEGLSGKRAFYFPENHSDETSDIKAFQILGLEENYFYYYYVTKDTETGKEVHVVARNHKTQENRHDILYEREAEAEKDASAAYSPFYVHMCADAKGEYRISIYENGELSVIDKDGDVKFNRTSGQIRFGSGVQTGGGNLLDLIDEIFGVGGEKPSYFDRDVTSVTTDGRYNFFIPVTLTVEDYTKLKIDPNQEGDNSLNTETYLLGYSYAPIGESGDSEYLLRYNENYYYQIWYWQQLAVGSESERDPEADWESAKKVYPDKYGYYKVATGAMYNITELGDLLQWKNQQLRKFVEQKKVDSTTPLFTQINSEAIEYVADLADGQRLEQYFFQDQEKGYCPLVGAVRERSRTQIKVQTSRSYTIVKGEGENRTEESVTESVDVVYAEKAQFQKGSAIERFFVLSNESGLYITPGIVEDGRYSAAYCLPGMCLLMRYDKSSAIVNPLREIMFPGAGADMGVYVLNSLGWQPYVLGADLEHKRLLINTPSQRWVTLMESDLNPSGYKKSEEDEKLFTGMQQQARKSGGYDASKADIYGNPDRYGSENVLILEEGSQVKILFSTIFNGIQLFEGSTEGGVRMNQSSSGTIYHLSDYPIYQAWRSGDSRITAVGFDRTDADYRDMDIARARIYEFDINTLMEGAASRQIPSQADGSSQGGSGGNGSQGMSVPEDMQQYWDDVKNDRENKPEPTGTETLPDVTIYETEQNMGRAWEEIRGTGESQTEESE